MVEDGVGFVDGSVGEVVLLLSSEEAGLRKLPAPPRPEGTYPLA